MPHLKIVFLVPWRSGDRRRTWCWDVARPYMESYGWPIVLGDSPLKEWARAHALNAASKTAGKWDIAIVADTDEIHEPGSLRRAIMWVQETGGAVRPHLERFNLNRQQTLQLATRGLSSLPKTGLQTWRGGGTIVITRQSWNTVGGYDESYIGWGHEDTAMNLELLRHAHLDRIPGRIWHLWHGDERQLNLQSRRQMQQLLLSHKEELSEYYANVQDLNHKDIW